VREQVPPATQSAPDPGQDAAAAAADAAGALATQLAQVHAALAAAESALDVVLATLPYFAPQQPRALALHYLPVADDGHGPDLYEAARWHDPEQAAAATPFVRSLLADCLRPELADAPTAPAWTYAAVAAATALPPELRTHLAAEGIGALAILPLYSPTSRTWHGLFTVEWAAERGFSVSEQQTLALLGYALCAIVSGQRAQREQAEALTEMRTLYEIGNQLNAAASMHEVLSVLAAPVAGTAAEHARLYAVTLNEAGAPAELVLLAEWGVPVTPRPLGERRPFGTIEWMGMSSQGPLILDDLEHETRFDAVRHARIRESGVRAIVMLPLHLGARWVGMASLMWRRPRHFTARERRLFTGFIKQAAVTLDNRLHMEQAHNTLRENQEQRRLLSSILDSLPLAVWVLDAQTLQRRLTNRLGAELAGQLADADPAAAAQEGAARLCRPDSEAELTLADLPFARLRPHDEPQRMEVDVVHRSGSRQSLECIAAPLHKGDGQLGSIIAVFSDITERRQTGQERLRMQGELIHAQAAALAERSTPVIPLSDRILVMPIIGSIDTERAGQIMDSLLAAIGRTQARVALIDITGVPTVDSLAAGGLLNAARAVSLLGAQVLLTGIRAEVAQTLVKLGLELHGVVTCATLQAGIAYAQKRWGNRG
jgi:anti-anti-sigma factor